MRITTVAVTTLAATAALVVAWHEGAGPATGPLAGVHVVAVPPTRRSPAGAASPSANANTPRSRASAHRSIDGVVVQTPYGDVQVRVVLNGQKITDIQALHLTDANGRSRQISADAAPTLRQEALASQSANVDTVSGATYTSEGYRQSLQAALDQAHA